MLVFTRSPSRWSLRSLDVTLATSAAARCARAARLARRGVLVVAGAGTLMGSGPAAPDTRGPAAVASWPVAPASRPCVGELRVRDTDGSWRAWWCATSAPARWPAGHTGLAGLVVWRAAAPGVEVGELALSGEGEAWRVRTVLVRIDPARQRLALDANVEGGRVRPWSVAQAPASASVALNAGMFGDDGPWGWVVHGGRELQPPGAGALASAVVVGTDGRVRVVEADSLHAVRAAVARGEVAEALQGYPTLLVRDGDVPAALRRHIDARRDANAAPIDLEHRDARLAIGELRDGRVLVALTRFDALGALSGGVGRDLLGPVPLGLTVPEAAALMGALGARRAVLLDGGLSAQLAVRSAHGAPRVWGGLRRVPLGIVATSRETVVTAR